MPCCPRQMRPGPATRTSLVSSNVEAVKKAPTSRLTLQREFKTDVSDRAVLNDHDVAGGGVPPATTPSTCSWDFFYILVRRRRHHAAQHRNQGSRAEPCGLGDPGSSTCHLWPVAARRVCRSARAKRRLTCRSIRLAPCTAARCREASHTAPFASHNPAQTQT